jgi:hypothetical protein
MRTTHTNRLLTLAFSAVLLAGVPTYAPAQALLSNNTQTWSKPLLFESFLELDRAEPDLVRPSATPRLRMFGMPAGFLANPIGLEDDDDVQAANDPALAGLYKKDDDLKNVQIAMGMDNPYFDLRRPGNIGGVGYYQIYSQVQIVETGVTSMCVNLQAYTPAGVQWGGLSNGPTFICPALSVFHDLGQGTALQGFVCENLGAGWEDNWNRRMYYGMAWQCPLGAREDGVYFFVQGLGHFNYDAAHPAMTLMPGIQWRMADNCWLSLGGSRHGLITCSWQF